MNQYKVLMKAHNHKFDYCKLCGFHIACGYCGNNCCNGGSGENCKDQCKEAYMIQNNYMPLWIEILNEIIISIKYYWCKFKFKFDHKLRIK
jgi:hypothetical protein